MHKMEEGTRGLKLILSNAEDWLDVLPQANTRQYLQNYLHKVYGRFLKTEWVAENLGSCMKITLWKPGRQKDRFSYTEEVLQCIIKRYEEIMTNR